MSTIYVYATIDAERSDLGLNEGEIEVVFARQGEPDDAAVSTILRPDGSLSTISDEDLDGVTALAYYKALASYFYDFDVLGGDLEV